MNGPLGLVVGMISGAIGVVIVAYLAMDGGWVRMALPPAEHVVEGRDTSDAAIEELAVTLAIEVRARTKLAERMAELEVELAQLRLRSDDAISRSLAQNEPPENTRRVEAEPEPGFAESDFDGASLLERGIDPRDVARLRDRWMNYELDREAVTDQALREGWFMQKRHSSLLTQLDRELRADLQDEDYDRYLYALGKPNRLRAGEIFDGSTASEAGLHRGDTILRYNGVRVFNPGDLLLASSQGEPGDSVPMDILQNGKEERIYVRLGPLGVKIEHESGPPLDE